MSEIGACKTWEMQIVGYEMIEPGDGGELVKYEQADYLDPYAALREPPGARDLKWYRDLVEGTEAIPGPTNPFKGMKLTDPVPSAIFLILFAVLIAGTARNMLQRRRS